MRFFGTFSRSHLPSGRALAGGFLAIGLATAMIGSYFVDWSSLEIQPAAPESPVVAESDSTLNPAAIAGSVLNSNAKAVPRIDTLNPAFGLTGQELKIVGGNFDSVLENNRVFFSGSRAKVLAYEVTGNSTGALIVRVPDGLKVGTSVPVRVENSGGSTTWEEYFYVSDRPIGGGLTLGSLDPEFGREGATIYLAGAGFAEPVDQNEIIFTGGAKAGFAELVDRSGVKALKFTVPAGAQSGPITVRIGDVTAETAASFTVGDAPAQRPAGAPGTGSGQPVVLSISASSVAVGDQLLISGTDLLPLSGGAGAVRVRLGQTELPVQSVGNDGQADVVLVTIPEKVQSGFLSVSVNGLNTIYGQRIEVAGAPSASGSAADPISANAAPSIDASRSAVTPAAIDAATSSVSIFAAVADADGADDIVNVTADLTQLGGRPGMKMNPGELEGKGRIFELDFIPTQPLTARQYSIAITATDSAGNSGRGTLTAGSAAPVSNANQAPATVDLEPISPFDAVSDSITLDGGYSAAGSAAPRAVRARNYAGTVLVEWQPAIADATGGFVYFGQSQDALIRRAPAQSATAAALSGLVSGQRYFIAVSSVDSTGAESEKSAPISILFDAAASQAAQPVWPTASGESAAASSPAGIETLDYSAGSSNSNSAPTVESQVLRIDPPLDQPAADTGSVHSAAPRWQPQNLPATGPTAIDYFAGMLAISIAGSYFALRRGLV